jgi:hypothetical protein
MYPFFSSFCFFLIDRLVRRCGLFLHNPSNLRKRLQDDMGLGGCRLRWAPFLAGIQGLWSGEINSGTGDGVPPQRHDTIKSREARSTDTESKEKNGISPQKLAKSGLVRLNGNIRTTL